MPKPIPSEKGIVLYIVLVSILAALVIAGSILNLILSQTRFSQHETNRTQAYYAALAGANYGFDRLRSNSQPSCWGAPYPKTHCIYKTGGSCPGDPDDASCGFIDNSLPVTISRVVITVDGFGTSGMLKINSKAIYNTTAP